MSVVGVDKDLEIALELERIAFPTLFTSRSSIERRVLHRAIYRSIAFPTDFFTVLLRRRMPVARAMGLDAARQEQKIARRAEYIGPVGGHTGAGSSKAVVLVQIGDIHRLL